MYNFVHNTSNEIPVRTGHGYTVGAHPSLMSLT